MDYCSTDPYCTGAIFFEDSGFCTYKDYNIQSFSGPADSWISFYKTQPMYPTPINPDVPYSGYICPDEDGQLITDMQGVQYRIACRSASWALAVSVY